MIRNIFCIYLGYIAFRLLGKIGKICLLTVFVPLAGIHAGASCSFKCDPHSANPCEQINKRKCSFPVLSGFFSCRTHIRDQSFSHAILHGLMRFLQICIHQTIQTVIKSKMYLLHFTLLLGIILYLIFPLLYTYATKKANISDRKSLFPALPLSAKVSVIPFPLIA